MRHIVITESDHNRLHEILSSEFAKAVEPSVHLDDLTTELHRAQIVTTDGVPSDAVTMNSTVVLRDLDTDERETYTLVYPDEADIASGRLSVLAPVGTAILGQRIGDALNWRVPGGWRRLKLEDILYQPERAAALHHRRN